MSDELEKLAMKAVVDDAFVSAQFNERNSLAREATLARGVLALLSERRELVAGLREALVLANALDSLDQHRSEIRELLALAARIAPNQDGDK